MQVSLHSYSTSTGYHPTIKIVGFLARKFYKYTWFLSEVEGKEATVLAWISRIWKSIERIFNTFKGLKFFFSEGKGYHLSTF